MLKYFKIKKGYSLLYKTNRFHVAVRLFSNRSQKTSKCGKNISDTLGYASCATFLFLPHFDVICDLLLNRRTATWNLFVKWHCEVALYVQLNEWKVSLKVCSVQRSLALESLRKCLELTEARIKTRYEPNGNRKYNANKLEGD